MANDNDNTPYTPRATDAQDAYGPVSYGPNAMGFATSSTPEEDEALEKEKLKFSQAFAATVATHPDFEDYKAAVLAAGKESKEHVKQAADTILGGAKQFANDYWNQMKASFGPIELSAEKMANDAEAAAAPIANDGGGREVSFTPQPYRLTQPQNNQTLGERIKKANSDRNGQSIAI